MKPYYQDKFTTLYHGDCAEILPCLTQFDLILTDPPFGIGNFVQTSGNVRGTKVEWNDQPPEPWIFDEIKRHSRYRIIWGANYFNCFEGRGALIWIKNQPMEDFSKAEMASVNWGNKVEMLNHTWTNFVNTKETDHPCERPLSLYHWSIEQCPEKPRSICDPFAGSGSVLRCAKDLLIPVVGIELEERYCEIAAKRMAQEVFDFSENNCGQQLSSVV